MRLRWREVAAGVLLAGLAGSVLWAEGPKTITVGASGADFTTIQAAVNAAPEAGAVIRIKPGAYREVVHVDKAEIQFRGETKDRRRWCWCMGTARLRLAGRGVRGRCL